MGWALSSPTPLTNPSFSINSVLSFEDAAAALSSRHSFFDGSVKPFSLRALWSERRASADEGRFVAAALDGIKAAHVRRTCAELAITVILNTAAVETTGEYARLSPEDRLTYAAGVASGVAAQAKKRSGKVIQFKPYLERRRNEEA